ncbi:DUF5996 family protein [Carboxylicivirga sp. RSCT41]|uniref:DUF5996 family protein n=1 Tax=Carboxylicivirga agarovorans TaxID=3417570 RepID=UPI003D3375E1
MTPVKLPQLPYASWTDSRTYLHLVLQIIGKTRLGLTSRKNHWWFITLYVSSRGFSTYTIPVNEGTCSLEIELDIINKAVVINHSERKRVEVSLQNGLSIAQFYGQYMEQLSKLGLSPKFVEKPYDMGIDQPFKNLVHYNTFEWDDIERFWKLMQWNNSIFQEFSGRFYGKTCPVQIYWHHMDLAVTRFSGKKLEPMDKSVRISDRDAYSHEQISFGFWAGDETVQEPAYYSYTYPSPDGIDKQTLMPSSANWVDSNGSPMAFLRYEDVRNAQDPRQDVLDFLESAYNAGASLAGWDVEVLKTPALKDV